MSKEMEPISKALVSVKDRGSLAKMWSGLPINSSARSLSVRTKKSATEREVGNAIAWAESLTQIKKLTDEQRKALQIELHRLGFTKEELERRARSVAANPNREYGSIGLRWWIADLLLPAAEVDFRVRRRLHTILGEVGLRLAHPDAKEVGSAALARLEWEYEQEYHQEFNAELGRQRTETKKKLKALCARIAKMSNKEKSKLYAEAVKENIFFNDKNGKLDKFVLTNLHKSYIAIKLVGLPMLKGKQ
jgi:hypothetical protein